MSGRGTTRFRLVAWMGVVTAAVALLVVAVVDQGGVESEVERVQRLNSTFACPTCDGQAVADSNAPVSAVIRQFISDRVADGATDREIRDELVNAYTVEVLLNPPAEGFVALIWILPVMIAIGASVGVATAVTGRSQAEATRAVSAEDLDYVQRARDQVGATSGAGVPEPVAVGEDVDGDPPDER